MITTAAELEAIFKLHKYHFFSGLIAGGFVFFTLLALTVVWFLKNKLLRLLLVFTALQTLLVWFDFQYDAFADLRIVKLLLSSLFAMVTQQYLLEVNRRAQIHTLKFDRSKLVVLGLFILMVLCWQWESSISVKFIFSLLLSYWLYLGLKISQVLKSVRFSYRISGFLLWFYSWLIFALLLLPHNVAVQIKIMPFPHFIYIGWLMVSFFAALNLIHQVVQLNAENLKLEIEQLFLKNRLGLAQLESSENERKRIVAELHNDVLNRIDMLSMTINQTDQEQESVNKNLTDSLQVLRHYTYRLYPPHTDVLPLEDIFSREAELWRNASINIDVRFSPIWNDLNDNYIMPVFRFIEQVTDSISKQVKVHNGIWHFTESDRRLMLRLEYFGEIDHFSLNEESYLIYKDLLNAQSAQDFKKGAYQITLIFNK